MTLLSIVQDTCSRMALPQPAAVANSTDRQVLQLLALANEAGIDLMRDYGWQALRRQQVFATSAQQPQPAAIPADWDRFIPNSFFNRSTRRPMTGPITPRQHQWIQAQPVYSTVYLAFIERSGQFLIDPSPITGNICAYEYISENWAQSAAQATGAASIVVSGASFTGQITNGVLTASSVTGYIVPNDTIAGNLQSGSGFTDIVVGQLSGTPGGAGTYQLGGKETIASSPMQTGEQIPMQGVMNVSAVTGTLAVGQIIEGPLLPGEVRITGLLSGAGGTGTYVVDTPVNSTAAAFSAYASQPKFLADTDTALVDEELLKLSLRWRFKQAKGLDYAEDMSSFERQKERLMARDGGATALTLSPQPIDPNRINIPDGNFGV